VSLLALTVVGLRWPWLLAWPLSVLAGLLGLSLLARYLQTRRRGAVALPAAENRDEPAQ